MPSRKKKSSQGPEVAASGIGAGVGNTLDSSSTSSLPRFVSFTLFHQALIFFCVFFLSRRPKPTESWSSSTSGNPLTIFSQAWKTSSEGGIIASLLEPLANDPSSALLRVNGGLAVVQAWMGIGLKRWMESEKGVGKKEERPKGWTQKPKVDMKEEVLKPIFLALHRTFIASMLMHILIVLLGAPITSSFSTTYHLSLFLTLLSLTPLFFLLPPPSPSNSTLTSIFTFLLPIPPSTTSPSPTTKRLSAISPQTLLPLALSPLVMATLVGAVSLPLDWEAKMQVWPVASVFGGWIGGAVGGLGAISGLKI